MNIAEIQIEAQRQLKSSVRIIYQSRALASKDESGDSSFEVVILETPPQIRTVRFVYGYWQKGAGKPKNEFVSNPRKEEFLLAIPYMQFIFQYKRWQGIERCDVYPFLGFSTHPVELDDTIYFPLLPNVGKSFFLCFDEGVEPLVLKENWSEIISLFWATKFQQYAGGNRWPANILIRDTPLRSYRHWEKLTRKKGLALWDVDLKKDRRWRLPHHPLREQKWVGFPPIDIFR